MRDFGCDTRAVPAPPLPGRCDHAAPPSLLRSGCYLIEFVESDEPPISVLDGTLRVEVTTDGVIASGDLYERKQPEDMVAAPAPDPAAGIPIFPIADYRCTCGSPESRSPPRASRSRWRSIGFTRLA
jgi:hypothetical protein